MVGDDGADQKKGGQLIVLSINFHNLFQDSLFFIDLFSAQLDGILDCSQ
jgi:hypothetical protein